MVSPDDAANDVNWWKDERYAIYDLSPNSAIAFPAHDEKLVLSTAVETYKVRGYAYSGGGRRITRVELSTDKGKTWRLANIDYPEDKYRNADPQQLFGGELDVSWREHCFCWCFYDIDIPVSELKASKDILVRSMDESMCLQPRDMYWSVLGMMNNPWYRVAIHLEDDSLRFEHPTQPALIPGGWMERVKKAGGNLTDGKWGEKAEGEVASVEVVAEPVEEIKMTNDKVNKAITIDELRKHDNEQSPWFVVNNEVYDGTAFLQGHPGGAQSIISAAGLDATDEFMAIRKFISLCMNKWYSKANSRIDSETAKGMMPDYHIGSLDEASRKVLAEGDSQSDDKSSEPRPIFLESRNWNKAILHSKSIISWDTRVFTFKLDFDEQSLGLPIGQHLMMRLRDPVTREAIIRSYTPLSETTEKGFLRILIKVYFETKEQKGGKMTVALDSLPIGHFVDFKGPIGKFEYRGLGKCMVHNEQRFVEKFIMICGGSGITPIFQVLRAVMQDKEDSTKCVVLDGNRLIEDILCKEDLDRFALENPEKCELLYTLTKGPEEWKGLRGRIALDLLRVHAPLSEKTMILICGPEALEKAAHKALNEIGWKDENLLFF